MPQILTEDDLEEREAQAIVDFVQLVLHIGGKAQPLQPEGGAVHLIMPPEGIILGDVDTLSDDPSWTASAATCQLEP